MGLLDLLGGVLGQGTQGGQGGGLGAVLGSLAGGGQGTQGGGGLIASLLPIAMGMLANRGGAGGGGLGQILQQFQTAGLGQHADSWVGTGQNMPLSADDLARVLGPDKVAEMAAQAGVSHEQASGGLAQLLPELINHLTPQGQVPDHGVMEQGLDALRRQLGG